MKLRLHRYNEWELIFVTLFYMMVFQNPLTDHVSNVFSYIDEVIGLVGFALLICVCKRTVRIRVKRDTWQITAFVALFVFSGLIANVYYQYQPTALVLKDVYVNLKFFFSVITGYYLFRYMRPPKKTILWHVKTCAIILFSLLILDVCFDVFPGNGYRYGLKACKLFFGHATYLSATCVFLLSVLLFYYEKSNIAYMGMLLLVLVSTLRGKALAGAAVVVLVFYYVLVKRKKMKLWQITLMSILGIYIAWEQIQYYYVELAGTSARSVLTQTSFQILKDYFPLGTGFGTYASDVAQEYYSPVYLLYGFNDYYELQEGSSYFSDTFWPIVIGQTGLIGTICYIAALFKLFKKAIQVRSSSMGAYAAVLAIFAYLMISSTSESTFCNALSVPLAVMIGAALHMQVDGNHEDTTII